MEYDAEEGVAFDLGESMQTRILCPIEAGGSSSPLWLQDSSEDDAASKELETILALLGKTFEKKGK